MAVKVQVLDEKGLPVHCTVAAVRTSDQSILALYDTDAEGVANIAQGGTWYPRPMVTPSYKKRIKMVILNAQDSMNADYVVDVGGGGTHTALYGASGALAAAIASGVSKFIWVCASHTENVTSAAALASLAANQKITIASGGRSRAVITYSFNGAAHTITTPSAGAGSRLRFERMRLTRGPSNTGAFIAATGGPGLPPLEFVGIDWGDTTGHWTLGIDVSGSGSATYGGVLFEDCYGVGLAAFCNTSSAGAASGAFRAVRNQLTMTNGIVRSASTNFEVGDKYLFAKNDLALSSYLLQRSFSFPLRVVGNDFQHSGAQDFIDVGTAASTNVTDVVIGNNTYSASTVGARFCDITPAAGTGSNITIMGNALDGPGSGTAINVGVTCADSVILNGYRDWSTNVGGAGAGSVLTNDHGSLAGLLDDDHSIYALLAGRSGGQVLKGGTGSGDNLDLHSTNHATKGAIRIEGSTKFMLSIVSGNPRITLDTDAYLQWDDAADDLHFYAVGGNLQWSMSWTGGAGGDASMIWRKHSTNAEEQLWQFDLDVDTNQTGRYRIGRATNVGTATFAYEIFKGNNTSAAAFTVTTINGGTPEAKAFGNMEIDGDLNHDGSNIGFFGVAPAARAAAYTASNVTTDRSYDANATTIDELADILGTLIADLRTYGLVQ